LSDASSIARLHVSIWRDTYRDLAPTEVFRAFDEPLRLARWIEILSNPSPGQTVLLAEVGGQIVGLGAAGAPSHEGFGDRGEVRSLYVDPRFQRLGIGRTLIQRLAQHLFDLGFRGVALSVVVGNDSAIAFYQSLGGCLAGRFTDPGPIWRSENFIIEWNDLSALLARISLKPSSS
jgi:ribosomal protein S18 acetylase RimI-like enzyme